jgi:hypothetical protein
MNWPLFIKATLVRLLRWALKQKPESTESAAPAPSMPIPERPSEPLQGQIEPYSSTWLYVKGWAEAALWKARERNDNLGKDATQTAALRGEIRILKELIALPEPKRRGLLVQNDMEDTGY